METALEELRQALGMSTISAAREAGTGGVKSNTLDSDQTWYVHDSSLDG
ncbi:hypothetical protein ACIA9I_34355 [Streptomyces anulatus]